MRELKFKAWDKKGMRWITDQIGLSLDGQIMIFDRKAGEQGEWIYRDPKGECYTPGAWEQVELMQFTGLKDKNGREIYEGDIVKVFYENHDDTPKQEMTRLVVVDWREELCGFEIGYIDHHMPYYHDYEVLGNIYENPELLEAKP